MLADHALNQRSKVAGFAFEDEAPRQTRPREIEHILDQTTHAVAARNDAGGGLMGVRITGAPL